MIPDQILESKHAISVINPVNTRDALLSLWRACTYSDLFFKAVRLLSQLFHFTHGDVCQVRSLLQMVEISRKSWNEREESRRETQTLHSRFQLSRQFKKLTRFVVQEQPRHPFINSSIFYLCLPLLILSSSSLQVLFCKSKWPSSTLQTFTNTQECTQKTCRTHLRMCSRTRTRTSEHTPTPTYTNACRMHEYSSMTLTTCLLSTSVTYS